MLRTEILPENKITTKLPKGDGIWGASGVTISISLNPNRMDLLKGWAQII